MPTDRITVPQNKPQDSVPTIIDADKFMAITMDDISFKISQLIDLSIENQKTLSSLLDYTIKNEKRLAIIEEEMLAEADQGEFLRSSGIATTTTFTIIDTQIAPGHPVKGYTVINDSANTIYVGHNMSRDTVGPDIIDVTSATIRFAPVLSGEDLRFIFNRRKVRNVYILASGGDSAYRAWLTW